MNESAGWGPDRASEVTEAMSESDPSAIESSATTEQLTISEASSSSRKEGTLEKSDWWEIRDKRLALDGHSCANCGAADKQLHVHHIVPDSMSGTTHLDNLISLCYDCHDDTHIGDSVTRQGAKNSKEAPYVPMVRTLRDIIAGVDHPLERAIWVLLAKTGMGVDDLVGLEFDQLHLRNHPMSYSGIGPRRRRQPAHINLPKRNTEGVPGARGARLCDIMVPLDRETERVLKAYIAIRPKKRPSVDGNPVFLKTTRNWGTPLTGQTVSHYVEKTARRTGHYEEGAGRLENVTPITLAQFFEQRFGGQPVTKDYLLGKRDTIPMRFDRLATDYREGVPRLLE